MKVIFGFLILSLLLVSGCTVNTIKQTVTVTTTETSVLITPYLVNIPLGHNKEISRPTLTPCDYNYFWVGQDKINIGNMYPGAVADTWKSDMKMVNGYKYKSGEPLCFTIYNNSNDTKAYDAELDTGYYGQPADYANWVTISALEFSVPPRMAMNIPVSLQIPENVNETINHQWEFRVGVIPTGTGNVQYASWVRFIVTMRDK